MGWSQKLNQMVDMGRGVICTLSSPQSKACPSGALSFWWRQDGDFSAPISNAQLRNVESPAARRAAEGEAGLLDKVLVGGSVTYSVLPALR